MFVAMLSNVTVEQGSGYTLVVRKTTRGTLYETFEHILCQTNAFAD